MCTDGTNNLCRNIVFVLCKQPVSDLICHVDLLHLVLCPGLSRASILGQVVGMGCRTLSASPKTSRTTIHTNVTVVLVGISGPNRTGQLSKCPLVMLLRVVPLRGHPTEHHQGATWAFMATTKFFCVPAETQSANIHAPPFVFKKSRRRSQPCPAGRGPLGALVSLPSDLLVGGQGCLLSRSFACDAPDLHCASLRAETYSS